ncbi:MAG TPA: CPBP family glutamic-type intramembrane protease [Chitinophagales bacterium]|nr:CPBP family glutamic-type intramembrane protease [Chitinophagales bacterium]
MDLLNQKLIFIVTAILFWIGYVILQVRKDHSAMHYWGFTTQNFGKSFMIILPVALSCIGGMMLYAHSNNIVLFNPHIIPILILYPLWGFIQQFLVVGLVAGNLKDMHSRKVSLLLIVLSTSVLFSLVHYPSILLMIATFLLAIFYTLIYLRYRNLISLGLFHGWLGCFFMIYVLNRDPWQEVFTSIVN